MAKVKAPGNDPALVQPTLGVEDGTSWGWFDRWNLGTTPDGKYVVDLSDWAARDMEEMLRLDYKSVQIENVLALPILSATWHIEPAKGDTGEAAWTQNYWDTDRLSGGCKTPLEQIIGLMTSAFYYRRAYFEKVFRKGTGPFTGKIVYDDVAWRPQTTCRLMREPENGNYVGFEQEAYYLGPKLKDPVKWPIQIPSNRAFVYTHGTWNDPLNGKSDLEVGFWAWKTKQKLLMLWMQFLQGVALPRTVVKAVDTSTAQQIALQMARLKSSGVMPIAAPNGLASVEISTLDVSGKGSEQFQQAISWLDSATVESVLAGFLNLTGNINMSHFGGSYSMSKDASDFFLQALEAKVHEMEVQIREQLFAPLIFFNFGANAAIPHLKFEPLNDIDKQNSIDLLKAAIAAPPGGPIPTSFISGLANQVATYLGLDGDAIAADFKASFDAAAAQAQAGKLADNGAVGPNPPAGAGAPSTPPGPPGPPGKPGIPTSAAVAGMAAVADKATNMVAAHATKVATAKNVLLQKHAKNALAAKTGGKVTL